MTFPAFVGGALISTLFGAGFHLFFGGNGWRLGLYLLAGWLGFALGHIVGNFSGVTVGRLGPLNLLTATLGSWIALFAARWLANSDFRRAEK